MKWVIQKDRPLLHCAGKRCILLSKDSGILSSQVAFVKAVHVHQNLCPNGNSQRLVGRVCVCRDWDLWCRLSTRPRLFLGRASAGHHLWPRFESLLTLTPCKISQVHSSSGPLHLLLQAWAANVHAPPCCWADLSPNATLSGRLSEATQSRIISFLLAGTLSQPILLYFLQSCINIWTYLVHFLFVQLVRFLFVRSTSPY